MGIRVVPLFVLFIAAVKAIELSINKKWREDYGWEITCSWKLFSNDSLQSLRLYRNERQFLVFRPEVDGTYINNLIGRNSEESLTVVCSETTEGGVTGDCVFSMELYQPQAEDFQYSCEVSGERPKFRRKRTDMLIEAVVPPMNTVITGTEYPETGRVTVNCSCSGMPAPSVTWTIGTQQIPPDFAHKIWNATSKLWSVWSVVSYTPQNYQDFAICRPEVKKGAMLYKGTTAFYSSANNMRPHLLKIIGVILSVVLFRR